MLRNKVVWCVLAAGLCGCAKEAPLLPTETPSVEAASVVVSKTWTAVDLGGDGLRIVYDINDQDRMVGESDTEDGLIHAGTVDRDGVWQDFPSLSGYPNSFAISVNNYGVSAGVVASLDYTSQLPAVWLVNGGIRTPTGGPLPTSVLTEEISDLGTVVGLAQFPPSATVRAFRWQVGSEMHDLGSLVPGGFSAAYGINTAGTVVGASEDESGRIVPVRWDPQGRISAMPLPPGLTRGEARSINDRGEIVARTVGQGGWRWTAARGSELLPLLPGATGSDASAIDAKGRIFGIMTLSDGIRHPIVWIGTTPTVLPDFGGPASLIRGANRCGQAVGNEPTHMVLYDTSC